jgi:type IV pilus assembly protein PilY1
MCRIQWIATAVLLVLGVPTLARAQAPADVRNIKPIIMLLVDTSGSMERLTDDTDLPVCSNSPTADADQKNRWAVTLEALTGTFNSFACREIDRSTLATSEMDYGYYLPHFDITTAANQSTDGLLDTYLHKVKFGLMTFDGVGTTLNGETLVPWTTYTSSVFQVDANGAQGMYSYGEDRQLSFPNCPQVYGLNAGARRAGGPGGLISAGVDGASVATTNASIQTALKVMRPFGSTPLAAMFSDLKEYFEDNSDVNNTGDPYFQCRGRYAVLLTDSAGDANDLFRDSRFNCASTAHSTCAGGQCQCPYDTDLNLVHALTSGSFGNRLLDQLFIVAFNVQDSADLSHLNLLAGPSFGAPDCTDPDDCEALQAATPTQLKQALAHVVASASTEATSRSVPVRVSNGSSALVNGKQYEITTGFKVGASADDPWEGLLYRQRIGCDSGQPAEFDLDESKNDLFHVVLNDQPDNQRRIVTLTSGSAVAAHGTIISSAALNDTFTGDADSKSNEQTPRGTSISGSLPGNDGSLDTAQKTETVSGVSTVEFDGSINQTYFGDVDGNGIGQEVADRDLIVDYVRGFSRPGKKLADIYQSQPIVLPPLTGIGDSTAAGDERVSAARKLLLTESGSAYTEQGRPGVVFVGTNDAILHAFNLDDIRISGAPVEAGFEFWGFVPPALFSKLHTAAITHTSMFDGSPTLAEVAEPRDAASTAQLKIHTTLVSNVRGAAAFVALDITHPEEAPTPLWQFSDYYMGDTVGRAAITHVAIQHGGVTQLRPVAILPGGRGEIETTSPYSLPNDLQARHSSPSPRSAVRDWKVRGRALYVVDLLTGSLIQRFDPRHFASPVTGSVVAEAPGFGTSKAAYFTDEDGVLWRLSMLSTDPDDWRVQPVYDLFAGENFDKGRAATFPPVVTYDDAGQVVVVVGTGDLDNLVETDKPAHRIVSLTESRAVDSGGELDPNDTMSVNWKIELEPGESVTGPLVLFEDAVYFGTFRSEVNASDVCALGAGSLYAAHYRETDPNDALAPRPMLAADADGDGEIDDPVTYVLKEDTADDTLVLGVSINRSPVCAEGSIVYDPSAALYAVGTGTASGSMSTFQASGPASGGGYQMRAMVGGSGGQARGGSAIHSLQKNLQVVHQQGITSWASSVE